MFWQFLSLFIGVISLLLRSIIEMSYLYALNSFEKTGRLILNSLIFLFLRNIKEATRAGIENLNW